MSQKALSRWLYAIIIMVGLCMAAVYAVVGGSPYHGLLGELADSSLAAPFAVFFWLTALPILAALAAAWLIARNIGGDRSFSHANARHLRTISVLAALDGAYYLVGNLIFFVLARGEAALPLFQVVLALMAFVVSVAAAALSHLVLKAAALQEQSDLTI